MKLDYDFLKSILKTLETNESCYSTNRDIATALSVDENDKKSLDKLAGHLHVLSDMGCLDCERRGIGYHLNMNAGFVWEITESDIESAMLDWLTGLGWTLAHGPDLAPEGKNPECASYEDMLLLGGFCCNDIDAKKFMEAV